MKAYVFPGQGSQAKGMGAPLFEQFYGITQKADEILGYSVKALCLEDSERKLDQTRYAQPALYVVNALSYYRKIQDGFRKPDFLAGHSLGEYNALLAAECFDFDTGLKLVKKRSELMGRITGGAMAAIIGMRIEQVKKKLLNYNLHRIDIANYNAPLQIVISGPAQDIESAASFFQGDGIHFIKLKTSGAFHSRYMRTAVQEFKDYLKLFSFSGPAIPVISNFSARPYKTGEIVSNLSHQMTHSVLWSESIRYLMGEGVSDFEEIGPGRVLTKIIAKIKNEADPLIIEPVDMRPAPAITMDCLGDKEFKRDYNLKYAYLTGSMVHGIASQQMVVKMGKAGMMGYFGTGALSIDRIEEAILSIKAELSNGQAYGMNLLNGSLEDEIIDLYLKHEVKNIEASAYMQISPALVRFRLTGLKRNSDGTVTIKNRIMAKLSRPEVATVFLSPAPERIVKKLLEKNRVSEQEAELAKTIPMADDLCVEADSGGHTDQGVAAALLPSIMNLRDDMMAKYGYTKKIRVGLAGGIGTPEAAAAAFIMGADFILTGSINQCTVEAGTSDMVKDLLQDINVQDTVIAPAGDMFELGAKVQVLRKGVFFPARANKLYDLYRRYNSLDEIDEKTKKQLQEIYFKRSFDDIYEDVKNYYRPEDIERAERSPKQKMAFIFRWYFGNATRMALNGAAEGKVDFQIQCGPALGAFNQWVKDTELKNWRNRHVDAIALKIMQGTAELLNQRYLHFIGYNPAN